MEEEKREKGFEPEAFTRVVRFLAFLIIVLTIPYLYVTEGVVGSGVVDAVPEQGSTDQQNSETSAEGQASENGATATAISKPGYAAFLAQGKSRAEYIVDLSPKTRKQLGVGTSAMNRYVQEILVVTGQIDQIEREKLEGRPGAVHVPEFDFYVDPRTIKFIEEEANAGRKEDEPFKRLGDLDFEPLMGPDGVQYRDTRTGELCFLLAPVRKAVEEGIILPYYKEHHRKLRIASCARSKERQLISKAFAVVNSAGKNVLTDAEVREHIHATRMEVAGHLSGDHVWGVAFDSLDVLSNAKGLASEAGFFGGCESTLSKDDKNHFSFLPKKHQTSKFKRGLCKAQSLVSVSGLKKGAKKLLKKGKKAFKKWRKKK